MKTSSRLISSILVLFILGVLYSPSGMAQVGEVNENLKKSEKKSESSVATTTSTGEVKNGGFIMFLGDVFMASVGAAQIAALQNKHLYPERVSFIAYVDLGSGFENNTWNITTSARVNWGIFASEFRYNSLTDITGQLNTFEWLVGILRIPIQSFNLEYGIGFISIPIESQSFTANTIGFDFKIRTIGVNINSHYNWTSISNLGSRFKRSFEIIGDYEFLERQKFHLCLQGKYSFQQYFEQTNFSIASAGIVMKLY